MSGEPASAPITVAGEALVDVLLTDSGELRAFAGGASFNVARTVGRLGQPCQFLGRFGDDHFGRRLRAALEAEGVVLAVTRPAAEPTTLAVAEIDEAGVADYRFYLDGTAAGQLTVGDVPATVFAQSRVIALGGLALVIEPIASTLRELLGRVPDTATVLLDPNCRPRALPDLEAYRASVAGFLDRADLVKVSVEDLTLLDPERDRHAAAQRLLTGRPAAVLVTDGPEPVTIHTAGSRRSVPVPEVTVLDTVGAGDAFVAGFLTWWAEHGCEPRQAGDPEILFEATRAAVAVSAAACTVAGANLPAAFRWTGGAGPSGT